MPILAHEELETLLKDVSYRPGWTLTLLRHSHEGPMLRIEAKVLNSYCPEQETMLGINSFIPPMTSPEHFYEWLLWRLERVEVHECQEWFKVKGDPWHDPHKDDWFAKTPLDRLVDPQKVYVDADFLR